MPESDLFCYWWKVKMKRPKHEHMVSTNTTTKNSYVEHPSGQTHNSGNTDHFMIRQLSKLWFIVSEYIITFDECFHMVIYTNDHIVPYFTSCICHWVYSEDREQVSFETKSGLWRALPCRRTDVAIEHLPVRISILTKLSEERCGTSSGTTFRVRYRTSTNGASTVFRSVDTVWRNEWCPRSVPHLAVRTARTHGSDHPNIQALERMVNIMNLPTPE